MGLGDLINKVGDGLEDLATDAEHAVGTVLDDGSHLIGKGLDTLGLHDAARSVDNFGDSMADHLGDQVAEQELGQTDDPTLLIHGDPGAIAQTATRLQQFAAAFAETAEGLTGMDTAHWKGSAADAFRQAYQPHPAAWSDAQDACATAASAWQTYGQAVQAAQDQARQAIALHQQGDQSTTQAQAGQQQLVATYNQQVQNYNNIVMANGDPGPLPRPPLPYTDPGEVDRQHAQDLLDAARRQRDTAATQAQQAISGATTRAPATPAYSQRMLDDLGDATMTVGVEGEHVVGGAMKSIGDLGKLARSVLPLDPYNITHPADYVDGLSSTAAGLLRTANHPMDLVNGLVGTGWGPDPGEALGRLLPNLVGIVATDGGSEAVSTADAASTAGRASMKAAERNAAELSKGLGSVEQDLAKIHVHDPGTMSGLQERLSGEAPADGSLATDPQVRADLAHTALDQPDLAVLDGLDDAVVWRQETGALYRSDNRGTDAFADGFPPRDISGLDVRDHVDYNPPNTAFVSTTTNSDYWQTWGSDCDYFYAIDAPGGIDVNATLGQHQNVHEAEIAMPGGVRPERITGLWPVEHDPLTGAPSLGDFVPNPHYRRLESADSGAEGNPR